MLDKAFTAVYWIAKEEIANVKLVSLLQLLENLGVSELKYLSPRSRPAVTEMFLIIGEVLKEHYLEKIKQVDSFGLLADETSNVYVLEQLIMFVKFVDYELGKPRTVFLSAECITDPSGPNAEVLTENILGVLKEFDLNINKMKSFVSHEASAVTGICWLSLEQSVQSVYKSYIALLYTFQELQADALALGFYKKIKTPKFLGPLFILKEVLPH